MKIFRLTIFVVAGLFLIGLPEIASGQLLISEFRLRGPSGANDEFIEIYNASGFDHTVAGGGSGYAIAASNGIARCIIPNGTVIPNRGHYLCVNSNAYSLASYPAGNSTTATGDATYTSDIPDNAGIAIFNTSVPANFVLANRMDAVGSTSEPNTLYKEGTGYPALTPFSIDHSFHRDECGKGGAISVVKWCNLTGLKDTNSNAADFIFVDTNGTSAGAGQRLGTPGPQNLSSPQKPRLGGTSMTMEPLDRCVSLTSPPNRLRDFTSDPANNSTFGTIDQRLRFVNRSFGNMTRLRFRIIDLTTFPAPSGIADLRPRTSTSVVVTVDRSPCGSGTSNVSVAGTTLEQPPSQPNGGGFGSTLSAGTITLATPLAHNAGIDLRFLFGIQQTGVYKFAIAVETLPGSAGSIHYFYGTTDGALPFDGPPADFDGDRKTDVSIYRPSSGQWWHRRSTNSVVQAATFGLSTDVPTPGDFTGDEVDDRAFFRPSTGQWFVLRSDNLTFFAAPFGVSTDIPVPGDYDGDQRVDFAVFRPSTATWIVSRSSDGVATFTPFGISTDRPLPADYDGDLRTDFGVFRPTGAGGNGEFWISYSNGGSFAAVFGLPTDKSFAGDFTGDGRADAALYRASTGTWFVLRSEDSSFFAFPFGVSTDLAAPGDYDGDRKYDAAVFRPSTSTWFINNSGGGITTLPFGVSTDQPVPNVFVK